MSSQDSNFLRKSEAIITIGLVLIFISLPVFVFLHNNSKFHVFQPFNSTDNAQNTSSMLFRGISDEQNNSSKPSMISSTSVSDSEKQNSSKPSKISNCPIKDSDEQNISSKPLKISSTPTSDGHKLVDELIASNFDKESCISRYQYSSYQKDKLYKPSPYLVSKIRSYEQLHARCGPQSSFYRKTMQKLSKSHHIHDNETLQCKYVVWTPANGLGNRMLSMASAFLYSILQNRVLLVEFGTEMDDLFCEPFPNSTWLLPKKFPHMNHLSELPTFKNRGNSGAPGFLPSFVHLDIHHGDADINIHHFHCNETHSYLEKIPVVILLSDQYFVPALFLSSIYKEELNRMFPEKDAVFHHLGRYLFNPSNEAWGLIVRFYQAYLAKSDEKIGIQIRLYHYNKALNSNIMSQILGCTQTQNILPALYNTGSSLNLNTSSNSKAILIASLYPEYAEELRSMYWTRPTVNGDVIGVYQPSHEEFQKFGDNMHNMKALAEIYLLSLCDVLMTSPRSTFGYVAQSLGGLKPWIMVSLERGKLTDPSCKRGFSMEPCFHVAPEYDCKGEIKINNYTNLYPHLRRCDDVRRGIKLFDTYMIT